MNNFIPKAKAPGSMTMPSGTRNTEKGKHGSGIAPKPSGGADIMGNDRPSMPAQAGLARVKPVGMGFKGFRLPVQSPQANIKGMKQPKVPSTAPAATKMPNRKGGANFFGES
jgi:hypothetical protein